ncbi:regulatory protein RecX [Kitasatospora sp. NPDC056181]|uniref:regulatory protein RecX n=1 Tax=Kitasatospora sp. NPDC056181 TaxID=3345737 RepID=UPI0035DA4C0B
MQDDMVSGGPAGPEGDDYGPPDWFAAVAEPEPVSWSVRPERPERPARRERPERSAGPGEPVDGLGLVSASELPTGRRRRRSALAEGEPPGHRAGEGAAGHGGAAAPASSAAGPRGRRARTRARTDAAAPGEAWEPGRDGTAEKPRRAARGARAEEPADPEARARDICLRLLTGAAKSRKQLADALRKREIPDEVAEQVLTRLEEVGLIDDAAFARAWVESRHAVRGLSRRALAQELRTKGVAGELVEQAVAQLDHDDETEAARALVERKLRATRGLERQARMRRLVGVLARRGYSEGLAFRVVREVLDDEASVAGPEEEDVDGASADGWE